jgi:hypothetical protein
MFLKAEAFLCEIFLGQVPADMDDKLIISKTPCTLGLEQLPALFQHAKILFLMRDGRSVACSLEKSFKLGFLNSISRWQKGACQIIKFRRDHKDYYESNCLLIRYEDLFIDTTSELKRCFGFLGINQDMYDFDRAGNSNVIGSSDLAAVGGSVNWQPLPRAKDFSPHERYKKWPVWKQETARATLCKQLRQFDYDTTPSRSVMPLIPLLKVVYALYQASRYLSIKSIKKAVKHQILK